MAGITEGCRLVSQPPEGLLPLGRFDPVPISLNDGRVLSRENLAGDIVGGAVKLLAACEMISRESGYDMDERAILSRAERAVFEVSPEKVPDSEFIDVYSRGIAVKFGGGFDYSSIDCACKLSAFFIGNFGQYGNASRIRADDRTCGNIRTMVTRVETFLDLVGPVRRMCFRFPGGYGRAIDDGCGEYLTDGSLWDVCTSRDPLPLDNRLRLLVRYVMCTHSKDPLMKGIKNIGIVNPRLNCAYMMPVDEIPEETLYYAERGIVGLD